MKRIKSLTVGKISLLTSGHSPAVPKAGIGFSILKFFTKGKPEMVDSAKLDTILKNLSSKSSEIPSTPDRLGSVIEKMSKIANDIEKSRNTDKTTLVNY